MKRLFIITSILLLLGACTTKTSRVNTGSVSVGINDDTSLKPVNSLTLSVSGLYISTDGTNWIELWTGNKSLTVNTGSSAIVEITDGSVNVDADTYFYLKLVIDSLNLDVNGNPVRVPNIPHELTIEISNGVEIEPGKETDLIIDMNSERWIDISTGTITGNIGTEVAVQLNQQ